MYMYMYVYTQTVGMCVRSVLRVKILKLTGYILRVCIDENTCVYIAC